MATAGALQPGWSGAGEDHVELDLTSSTPAVSVTGLEPATTYVVQVRALDAAGNRSAWSPFIQVTTS